MGPFYINNGWAYNSRQCNFVNNGKDDHFNVILDGHKNKKCSGTDLCDSMDWDKFPDNLC